MSFLEKTLEEIIFNADKNILYERGLYITGKLVRQLRIGNYGVADLVSFTRLNKYERDQIGMHIDVYELKKDKIGVATFMQAIGYVKGIESYLKQRKYKYDISFSINLIGSSIENGSSFSYLTDLIPCNENGYSFLNVFTYSYEIDGIRFKDESGYKLIDDGFRLKRMRNERF